MGASSMRHRTFKIFGNKIIYPTFRYVGEFPPNQQRVGELLKNTSQENNKLGIGNRRAANPPKVLYLRSLMHPPLHT